MYQQNMWHLKESKEVTDNIKTEENKATLHDINENTQVVWEGEVYCYHVNKMSESNLLRKK